MPGLLALQQRSVQFAVSFVNYFNLIAQLGIPTYGIRACAKVREDRQALTRTAHELLMINLGMCLASYLALGLCITFIPRVNQEKTLFIIISTTLLLNAIGMEWLYKALEQYTYITVRSVAFKVVSVAAMFLLVHKQEDYVVYGAITIFAASASFACSGLTLIWWFGFPRAKLHPYPLIVEAMITEGFPL